MREELKRASRDGSEEQGAEEEREKLSADYYFGAMGDD